MWQASILINELTANAVYLGNCVFVLAKTFTAKPAMIFFAHEMTDMQLKADFKRKNDVNKGKMYDRSNSYQFSFE